MRTAGGAHLYKVAQDVYGGGADIHVGGGGLLVVLTNFNIVATVLIVVLVVMVMAYTAEFVNVRMASQGVHQSTVGDDTNDGQDGHCFPVHIGGALCEPDDGLPEEDASEKPGDEDGNEAA